jgi:hypothetical protein
LREGVEVRLPGDDPDSIVFEGIGWSDRGETVFDSRPRKRDGKFALASLFYSPETPTRAESLPGIRVRDVASDGAVLYERAESLYVARSVAEITAAAPPARLSATRAGRVGASAQPRWRLGRLHRAERAGRRVRRVPRPRPAAVRALESLAPWRGGAGVGADQ